MKEDYLIEKRLEILDVIKPICEAFKITNYDYEVDEEKGIELLRLNDTRIGCSCNSVSAVVDELVGYIFIKRWSHNRSLGAFEKQTTNVIKAYWVKGEK
jgi:hypothetical protein